MKTAIWDKISTSLTAVPPIVQHAQIWFLVHIIMLVRLFVHPRTFYEGCKLGLLSAAIVLIIMGLHYGKQWARIIASSLFFLVLGTISLYYLIPLIKDVRTVDPVELFVFSFFALVSLLYFYLAIGLWIGKSVQKHFHSSGQNLNVLESVSNREHIQ